MWTCFRFGLLFRGRTLLREFSPDTHIMVLMHFKGMSWSKPTNNKTILPLCEGKSTFFFFRAFSRAFFASFRGSANTTDQDIRWHKGFSTVDSEENYPSRICLLHRERKTIIKQQHYKYFCCHKNCLFFFRALSHYHKMTCLPVPHIKAWIHII